MEEIITLDYGSGGLKTSQLIESVLLPAFSNEALNQLGDGAVLENPGGPLVFSTDSFVVSPWRFPGGDIGKLAVCGTVNDLSMAGGRPWSLSLSFILEEGLPMKDFQEIAASIAKTARETGVSIVTGDTKVVEKGKGDGIYINTSGIGFLLPSGKTLGKSAIRPGDRVILSGPPGCHGTAVMMARGEFPCEGQIISDCRPLNQLSAAALEAGGVKIMRDPTRGGVATTLNEFTENTPYSIRLEETAIPRNPSVEAACSLLGLDPLYCACEGRMLAIVSPEKAEDVLKAIRRQEGGEEAAIIGEVTSQYPGKVILTTPLGGSRILGKLTGNQLPRIC